VRRAVRASLPPWLAWSCFALGLALFAIAQVLSSEYRGRSVSFALLLYAAVGALVASRRPQNPIGWLFLAIGVAWEVFSAAAALGNERLRTTGSAAGLVAVLWLPMNFWLLSLGLVPLLLLYFPNGRLLSHRWRAAAALTLLTAVGGTLTMSSNSGAFATRSPVPDLFGATASDAIYYIWGTVINPTLLMLGALAALSLPTRLRRSRGDERQQLKWFVYAAASTVMLIALFTFTLGALDRSIGNVLFAMALVPLPAATAIAILRYRLFDIDLLIKRTLVYGATTAAIAVSFFLGIVALQPLLRPLTSGTELAVAASTLASFALFQPIRRRVYDAVDRRFDRSRYDATRTIDAFAVRLRDEVDLDALRRELIGVVRDTMQPTHSSVWLRGGER